MESDVTCLFVIILRIVTIVFFRIFLLVFFWIFLLIKFDLCNLHKDAYLCFDQTNATKEW